ncbi:hypothetical protein RG959_23240 [Domibacillus sp. 8LH]|uniref:LexA family protein n=1 Tax=Domibacillus sp. 8LH TaxID=3073900 RepID=UPI0031790434
MHSGFRRKLNQLMLYRIQDKGCSIKIFDLGGEVHTNHYLSSVREIGEGVNLKSTSTVQGHLYSLRIKGYLTWQEGKPRTLQVVREEVVV